MANARWKVGNTRPAVLITLDLGTDPETQAARTLQAGDTVTQIMRPPGGPAIQTVLTIVDMGANEVRYKPAAGHLDDVGTYDVEFDLTDSGGDIETIPDDPAANYSYEVGAKIALV